MSSNYAAAKSENETVKNFVLFWVVVRVSAAQLVWLASRPVWCGFPLVSSVDSPFRCLPLVWVVAVVVVVCAAW